MRNRMLLCAMAVAGLALTCRPANAQVVYEFASNTSPFLAQTSFSVAPGGAVTVRVYFHETAAGAPTLSAGNSTVGFGMTSAGARVTTSNLGVSGLPVAANATTAVGGPWQFGTILGGTATSAVVNDGMFPGGGTVLPDTGGRIFLGTFSFTGVAGGTATLSVAAPNGASDNQNVLNGNTTVNPGTNATLTVTGVPEPSSLLLGGLGLAGLAALKRRKKAAAQTATAA